MLGALIGLGFSVTSDATTKLTQKHLKGYENLDPHAANLAFKVQSEWGEEITHRLIKRMDTLASLAAIMEAGPDMDVDLIIQSADRAHHVQNRIKSHINHLMSVENENVDNKETLTYILEWSQGVASNIDIMVREKCKMTAPPVPCEYEEVNPVTNIPKPKEEQPTPTQQNSLMTMGLKLLGGMFTQK